MRFEIEAPDGRIFEIEGKRMPTEQELKDIYSQFPAQKEDKSFLQSAGDATLGAVESIVGQGIQLAEGVKNLYSGVDTSDTKAVIGKTKQLALDTDAGEVGKAFVRGGLSLVQNTAGEGMSILGDFLMSGSEEDTAFDKITTAPGKGVGYLLKGLGEGVKKITDMGMESDILKEDVVDMQKGFTKPTTILAETMSSLLGAFGVAKMTKSTVLPAFILSSAEGNPIYSEAKEAGKTPLEAFALSAAATTGGALLENVGLQSTSKGIVRAMMDEGFTEASQGVWNSLVRKYGYDDTVDIYEGVLLNAIVGGISGGGVAVVDSGLGFVDKLKSRGLKDSDISVIENAVVTSASEQGETINTYLQDVMSKNLEQFYKTIDESIDPLELKAKQEKAEQLQAGYEKYYNQLKEFMPDLEAQSNAKLIQSSALMFSEAYGMSVEQYFNEKAPNIIKQDYKDFKPKNKRSVKTQPYSLLKFIKSSGGLVDTGGNLSSMGAKRQYIGLINKNGIKIDDMGTKLYEEGYFNHQPTESEVLELIGQELGGQKKYAIYGENASEIYDMLDSETISDEEVLREVENYLSMNGVDYDGMSVDEKKQQYTKLKEDEIAKEYELRETIEEDANSDMSDEDFFNKYGETKRSYIESQSMDFDSFQFQDSDYKTQGKADINTPEFKEWFGDSKVVDENGAPLVVYHGTDVEFDTFEKQSETSTYSKGQEFYFTTNKTTSSSYVKHIKNESIIKEVYLSIKKPFEIDYEGKSFKDVVKKGDLTFGKVGHYSYQTIPSINEVVEYAKNNGYDGVVARNIFDVGMSGKITTKEDLQRKKEREKELKNLPISVLIEKYNEIYKYEYTPRKESIKKQKEYLSGIISQNEFDTYFSKKHIGDDYIVFNPNQIKSVYNKGSFSKESDNIYMQNERSPRGAYSDNIIRLFERSDASTLPHELSHFWKSELVKVSDTFAPAKQILDTVDSWTNTEFKRKYKVEKDDRGYFVTNKKSEIVYDRRGQGFETQQEAMEYAKEELFAQGFEAYLRKGKAPSNALKTAFNNFLYWLKKIYRDAKSLDIMLSPDMELVYSEILGGVQIDEFLSSDVESFMSKRKSSVDEINQDIEKEIIANRSVKDKSKKTKAIKDANVWEKAIVPLSTRLKRLDIKLRTKLRKYEYDILQDLNKRYIESAPFLKKWNSFSDIDSSDFDLALKNGYTKKIDEIVAKYEAQEDWAKIKDVLQNIYEKSTEFGIDMGFTPEYFPRKVADVDGYMSYLQGTPEWANLEAKLREVDPENLFTIEEKAAFFNKYLKGFVKLDKSLYKYGSEKERSIGLVTADLNRFYEPSMSAYMSYVENMSTRINNSRFLGSNSEKVDESIGIYINMLLDNKMITFNQVDEVRAVLRARLNQKGVQAQSLRTAKNLSYIYLMGGINSAITQIEDISTSMYKAGVFNTMTTLFNKKEITREDLGLEKMAQEYVDGERLPELLNTMFKATGLNYVDALGKETLVNASFKNFQKKINDQDTISYIESIMEQEAQQTIEDIKNGEISDNVKFLLFNELSDMQPISLSELPEYYNTGGNARLWYMLKSFAIKRLDIYRNEVTDKIRYGDRAQKIEGMRNLFKLALFMALMGSTKDLIVNLLYGREIELSETVTTNLINLSGVSKYQIYRMRQEGFAGLFKGLIFPPVTAFADDLIQDVLAINAGKREIKNMEILKGMPLFGRFYYWHIGRGKEKLNKRNKKSY